MTKAIELSQKLEKLDVEEGMNLIEQSNREAIYFDVFDDAMCILHKDGSVNIIEINGKGPIICGVLSPDNVLKVLHHYRPFIEAFNTKMH